MVVRVLTSWASDQDKYWPDWSVVFNYGLLW